jgi:hypothetical protein
VAEAARRAGAEVPRRGWQARGEDEPPRRELELLTGLIESARELMPEELQRRLAEALRELLLALRALIDWCLERAERHGSEPPEVEDIPIS